MVEYVGVLVPASPSPAVDDWASGTPRSTGTLEGTSRRGARARAQVPSSAACRSAAGGAVASRWRPPARSLRGHDRRCSARVSLVSVAVVVLGAGERATRFQGPVSYQRSLNLLSSPS